VLDYFQARTRTANDRQLSQLAELFGAARYRPAEPVLRPLVRSGGGPETRAAACWALGYLNEGKPDAALTAAFAGRVAAVVPGDLEDERVRWMSAIALGRMKAAEALPALRKFCPDGKLSRDPVNNACGWAIARITGVPLPPPGTIEVPQRVWFLTSVK